MKSVFQKIAMCAAVACLGLSVFTACEDEGKDEFKKPGVWLFVNDMYEAWGNESECEKIKDKLSNPQTTNETAMTDACGDYDRSLKESHDDYMELALEKTNSGYYQAAYITYYRLYNDVVLKCSPKDRNTPESVKMALEALMERTGCKKFAEHADTFTDNRGL